MIKEIRLANFKAFLLPQRFSLRAIKSDRLQGNYLVEGRNLIYKSAAIFAGNNVGKTSFLEAVLLLKSALSGKDVSSLVEANVHAKDGRVRLGLSFYRQGKNHSYSLAYDAERHGFLEEEIDGECFSFFHSTTLLGSEPEKHAPFLEEGEQIEVLFMDELPPSRGEDELSRLLLSSLGLGIEAGREDLSSLGTKRAAALVPHVVDALVEEKALFIDEFDSGLSFVLTRAIVSLFNNIDNPGAQLVFASHDITLLDTKRLFLLPQIKLIAKKGRGAAIFSLEKLVKQGEDAQDLFLRGKLGSINRAGLAKFLVELAKRRNHG